MEKEVLEVLTSMLTAAGALRTSDGESKWLEGVKVLHSIPTTQTGDYAGFQVSSPVELLEGKESGVALQYDIRTSRRGVSLALEHRAGELVLHSNLAQGS